jgi:hypothetical protein
LWIQTISLNKIGIRNETLSTTTLDKIDIYEPIFAAAQFMIASMCSFILQQLGQRVIVSQQLISNLLGSMIIMLSNSFQFLASQMFAIAINMVAHSLR